MPINMANPGAAPPPQMPGRGDRRPLSVADFESHLSDRWQSIPSSSATTTKYTSRTSSVSYYVVEALRRHYDEVIKAKPSGFYRAYVSPSRFASDGASFDYGDYILTINTKKTLPKRAVEIYRLAANDEEILLIHALLPEYEKPIHTTESHIVTEPYYQQVYEQINDRHDADSMWWSGECTITIDPVEDN